jgi:hypothetical protein
MDVVTGLVHQASGLLAQVTGLAQGLLSSLSL